MKTTTLIPFSSAAVKLALTSSILLIGLAACVRVHVDPLEVKPITLNVNVKYVDEKLDDFYAFQKKYDQGPATQSAPATQPAAMPAAQPEIAPQ